MISAQSTPTNNGVQSIYFVGKGQGVISTHSRMEAAAVDAAGIATTIAEFQHTATRRWLRTTLLLT